MVRRLGVIGGLLFLAACSGNEAAERWEYERILWEGEPGIRSGADAGKRYAEIAARESLTLDDCYRLALHRSETLAIDGEELVRLRTAYEQAIGSLLPRISFKGSYTRQQNIGGGTFGSFTLPERKEFKFTLRQPIFNGLQEVYALRQSDALAGAKEHDLRHARLLLYAEAAEAFYAVLAADRERATLQAGLELARERLAELRQRNKIGIARRSEVLAQEADVASTEAKVEAARGTLEVAWEVMQFLTGLGSRPELVEGKDEPAIPPDAEILVDRARKERRDLRSLEKQVEAAEEAVRLERGKYLPTAAVDANYYLHRDGVSGEIDWDVILSFEVPLFDGLTTYAKIREAESSVRAARLQRDRRIREIRLEVRRAYAQVRSLRSELASLEKAVTSATENYSIVRGEYRQGIVTNIEVLASFDTLQRTRLSRDRARYQLKVAQVRLAVQGGGR